jgi:hypothetical protein
MITIITKPISRYYDFLKFLQNIAFRLQGRPIPNQKYGGHYAVTRSLIEGLEKIKADFNYNPKNISDMSDTVYVPGGYKALKWAIKMKRKGKIKKLIAGPNQVITPNDNNGIIKSRHIDLFLANSEWIRDTYVDMAPELADHIGIWPAGVDTEFWKPTKKSGIEKNVLIYYKRPVKKMFETCKKVLEEAGFKVEVIIYGKYTVDQYKEALNRNSLLIHLVEQESQGISLAEAWSMNTPTIVWNPGFYFCVNGFNYDCSSAPYLNLQNGIFFENSSKFKWLILNNLNIDNFTARDWLLNNMSDEVCANKIIQMINKITRKN